MNDEQLIELVRNHTVLYDVSHQKYMDNSIKLNIWNKIGKEMNADGKYRLMYFVFINKSICY